MMRTDKKRDRAVKVANPNLGGTGVEIESTFFVYLDVGIGGGAYLDADFRSALEEGDLPDVLRPLRSEPGDVDGLHAASGRKRALGHNSAIGKQLMQPDADMNLALAMEGSRRRTHEDVAMLIGLDAVGELSEGRVGQNLGPTSQVNPGLRGEFGKLNGDRHRATYARNGKNACTRKLALSAIVMLMLLWVACWAGLRINGTHSFPVGFYFATGKQPGKGDLVYVDLPALPIFTLAKARGYLNVAYSPTLHLLKRLAGVAGDRVTIDSDGVEVNGIRLANSAPCNCDGAGRPLQAYLLKDYILGAGEVLLMSDYNPASFDSRYFGPIQTTTIQSVITPLLTWN